MSASVGKPLRKKTAAPGPDRRPRSPSDHDRVDAPHGRDSQLGAWREVVQLWLQWNTAYEQITERLYQHGRDPRRIEDLMDQMDQVRRQAVRQSRELVD